MRRVFIVLFGFVCLLFVACQSEYHAYDTRVDGACDLHATMIPQIESRCQGRDTFRFAVISDTQRWYDETKATVEAINRRDDVDFVIHCGDMTDWGLRDEFERQRDILQRLKVPFVVLIGNHDCLATGGEVFRKIFGEPHFSFTAGDVRFVCVDSNALEHDDVDPVPDFDYLERELAHYPAEAARTVVVMHAAPHTEQLYGWKADRLHRVSKQFPDLQFCLHGHGHKYLVQDLFEDGVIYYQAPSAESGSYLLFTIHKEGYEQEEIFY